LSSLVEHVNSEAGTQRNDKGRLGEKVGRHDSLDELAKKFISTPSQRETLRKQAEKEGETLGEDAKWYGKFMKVISSRGEDWVSSETARVTGLLEGDNLSADKVDEFTIRKNVLSAFEKE